MHGASQTRDRLLGGTLRDQRIAEIVHCFVKIRLQRDSRAELSDRLRISVKALKAMPEIVVRNRISELHAKGGLICRQRFVLLPDNLQRAGKSVKRLVEIRLCRDGPPKQLNCRRDLPCLRGDDCQQMKRQRMIGLLR